MSVRHGDMDADKIDVAETILMNVWENLDCHKTFSNKQNMYGL